MAEEWTTFFLKTPKPTDYDKIMQKVGDFINTKRQEHLRIVLVSVRFHVLQSEPSDAGDNM